jgi:hypothetical protein
MAKQVNRTACVIESAGLSPFLESNFRPSRVSVLVGAALSISGDAHALPAFREVPKGPDSVMEIETRRNWVIFQMCRAGYAPIGTPGPYDVAFKLNAFVANHHVTGLMVDVPSTPPFDTEDAETDA